jgi:putative FmdB family regulatory protein
MLLYVWRLKKRRSDRLMPIYEYQCKQCGLHFERFQRMSDTPVQICPECSGQVFRVMQPVGVVFKGSGFYVTDNRKSSSSTLSPSSNHKDSNGSGAKEKSESTETAKAESEKTPDAKTTKDQPSKDH